MDKRTIAVSIIVGIVFPILVIITAMEFAVFNRNFFINELDKNNVAVTTGIAPKELPGLTDEIFSFLRGTREDFNIYAEKENDLYVPLFNEKEKIHMDDVRWLLKIAVIVQAVSLVILIVGLSLLSIWNRLAIFKALLGGSIFGIALLLLICLAGVFDFTAIFEAAHRLIFTNDYWSLDPAESILINIVPEPYFIHLCLRVLLISGALFTLGTLVFGYMSRHLSQQKFIKKKNRKF